MRCARVLRIAIVIVGCSAASSALACRFAVMAADSTSLGLDIHGAPQSGAEPLRRPGTVTSSFVPGDGVAAVRSRCVACHEPAMLLQQRLTAQQWMAEIDKMQGWGAVVSGDEKAQIARYLVAIAGPDNTRFTPPMVAPVSAVNAAQP